MSSDIHQLPVTTLKGVGPRLAEKLASKDIHCLQDLWFCLPRAYEDRTQLTLISALRAGSAAQVLARVEAVERGFRYRPILRVAVSDESHSTLLLRFFHFRSQQANAFRVGQRLLIFGDVRHGQHGLEMVHPSYRALAEDEQFELPDALHAIYPLTEGLSQHSVARLVAQALQRLPDSADLELIPEAWLRKMQFPSLRDAVLCMHQPPADADVAQLQSGVHPSQRRLALEELLAHQLSLRRQRIAIQSHGSFRLKNRRTLSNRLLQSLAFKLTAAQQRVCAEIDTDVDSDKPMLRLLQGDVGSGKTIVAAISALKCIESGFQVALMAPTELLAEQHLKNFKAWLEPLGLNVVWLAGKQGGKARAKALEQIVDGSAQMIVGTHAVMQSAVQFKNLALVIVDEQHRFGVHQRLALREKGESLDKLPHQLVMTATPIPRTLAMSAYADLDVSVLDELPPGRQPVQTIAVSLDRRAELIERVRAATAQGRQTYWVCPLIEESDEVEAQAAQSAFELLSEQIPECRVALLHGRLKPAEKQATMHAFSAGDLDLLVATTVIEVGVDVPNASLMIIENAERLGLAQLHQLRGRVGRGSAASTCVLLYKPPLGAIARERIEVLRQSNDGFVIAEKDLQLRGPGELLGTRQTGIASFRVADLMRDAALLPQVHLIAERLLVEHPDRADQIIQRWIGSAVRFAGA